MHPLYPLLPLSYFSFLGRNKQPWRTQKTPPREIDFFFFTCIHRKALFVWLVALNSGYVYLIFFLLKG